MCDELLDPYNGATSLSRNTSERSVLAEKLVVTFLRNRAACASVRWSQSGYGFEELYKGLWNTCQKEPYNQRVTVSKRDGKLILKRIGR